jgi:rhodanese-related sulfurtransferase
LALTATPAREFSEEAYNLVHWSAQTPDDPRPLGDLTKWNRGYGGFGAGTNAQDESLKRMMTNELDPFVSGGRISKPPYKVRYKNRTVSMTGSQKRQQASLEGSVASRLEAAVQNVKPEDREGSWKKRARDKERKTIQQEHWDNLHGVPAGAGADHNAKVADFLSELKEHPDDKKHVVYVDSAKQRQAIVAGLKNAGYKQNQIKNITQGPQAGEIEPRKQAWQTDPNIPFILIDKTSASGHNLQQGSALHVLGSPEDAANYLQAQGRIARMPREGDVDIITYKHDDSPFENKRWNALDAQQKLLGATAPGLFVN